MKSFYCLQPMKRSSFVLLILCLAAGDHSANCQSTGESTVVETTSLGEFECNDHVQARLGAYDRIFLIENQWEWDRCKRLMPMLPVIDLKAESLLLISSYPSRPRRFDAARSEAEQLTINVKQEKQEEFESRSYRPARFGVVQLPAWSGSVQFEINGHRQFTLLREKQLEAKVSELWEEILRSHSGGRLTEENYIRHFQARRPEPLNEDEIRQIKVQYFEKMKSRQVPGAGYAYSILFRDLINLQAKPAVPLIFKLLDSMGQHDPAFDPAWKSLVGIGGPEVIAGCREALKSENKRSRSAAALVLRAIAQPDTRPLAYEMLETGDGQLVRLSLDLLHKLGLQREDVPALAGAIDRLEPILLNEGGRYARFDGADTQDLNHLVNAIASLGADAKEALPTLERVAASDRYPSFACTPQLAQDAIAKIRGTAEPVELE